MPASVAGVAALWRGSEEDLPGHHARTERLRLARQRGGAAAARWPQLPHVMAMLIPEAWSRNPHMDPDKRAFYEYHASLMEPWDGPAAMAFTDGRVIGATLDRNGLRPGRYIVTNDDLVVLASEAGVLEFPPERVKSKGRLQPGRDVPGGYGQTAHHQRRRDQERAGRAPALRRVDQAEPDHAWTICRSRRAITAPAMRRSSRRQRVFGYTEEDLKIILEPMAQNGEEPIGSMGADTPLACLSRQAAAAVQLFQAAVCAGDQPADRSDPRRNGDVADQLHRHGAQHSGRDAAATATR